MLAIETIRSALLTSIFGRRIGMTPDEYLGGQKDIIKPVLDLTTASTGTAIPPFGYVNITASSLGTSAAGGTFLLSNPKPGVGVTIFNVNADSSAGSPGCTAMMLIRPSTAFVIKSTDGTTLTTVNLTVGSAITLFGQSSGIVTAINRTSLAGTPMNGTT